MRILNIISLALVLLEGGAGHTSILHPHAEELYKHAIPDSQGLHWYAVDDEGVVHRFGNSNDGKVVPSPCKNQGKKKDKK